MNLLHKLAWYLLGVAGGLVVFGLLFAPRCHAETASARDSSIHIDFQISPNVYAYLAKEWDKHAKDPNQVERAYCMGGHVAVNRTTMRFTLTSVEPATDVHNASSYGITYYCPPNSIDIHTHTPTTCDETKDGRYVHCRLGGRDAHLCFASPADLDVVDVPGWPLSFLQCDREALVPYVTPHRSPPPAEPESDAGPEA